MPTCAEQVAAGVRSYPLDVSVLCSALAFCVVGHHLFPTTVKRESCKVHKQLCTGEFPTTLVSVIVVAAVGLSSFCGSYVSDPYPTHPCSLIKCMWFLSTPLSPNSQSGHKFKGYLFQKVGPPPLTAVFSVCSRSLPPAFCHGSNKSHCNHLVFLTFVIARVLVHARGVWSSLWICMLWQFIKFGIKNGCSMFTLDLFSTRCLKMCSDSFIQSSRA